MSTRFRPDHLSLLMAAIAALGAALILGHEFAFGVILNTDSAQYIAAARNLLAGEGLLRLGGNLFTFWPPLYPLLLAVTSLGIFDPIVVAGPLNAIIFGLTVFAVGQYLQQRLESRFLAVWGCLATALAIPLLEVSSCALSDPLFILLATLALVQTDRFLTGGRLQTLVWAAVFSALAWQTRYIGVAVPACVGLLLLFHPQAGTSLPQRVGRFTAYSLIVAVPMALWLLRNYLATGELTEHGAPAGYPVSMMLRDVVNILWGWVSSSRCRFLGLPYWPLFNRTVLVLLAITAALLAPVGCMLIARQWKRRTVAHWRPLWLFGGFALTYLVLLIVSLSLLVENYIASGVEQRLLTPLYIPLLIASVFVLDRIFSYERERRLLGSIGRRPVIRPMTPGKTGSVLVATVTIILSLGIAKQTVPAASTVILENCDYLYFGFNRPRWTGSEVLRYVRENPVAGEIYSNAPWPLSLHIGGEGVNRYHILGESRRSRCRVEIGSSGISQPANQGRAYRFAKCIPDGAYVIWFDKWNHYYDYGEADLRSLPGLEPVAELADGVVFKVGRDIVPSQATSISRHTLTRPESN